MGCGKEKVREILIDNLGQHIYCDECKQSCDVDISKDIDMDMWLYPEDLLNADIILNISHEAGYDEEAQISVYKLPENWRDIVTQDKGKDGKKSVHDVMFEVKSFNQSLS